MNFSTIIEKLSRVPRAQRIVIYAVAVIALSGGFWALFYLPASDNLDTLQAEQQKLRTQKAQVEDRVKNAAQYRTQLENLTNDLTQALKELPNDREIPGLLKGISGTGKKVGLEVRKFQPLPEEKREYVAEVPVALEVVGSFHEVAMFFDRLSKMPRIVYIQDIEIGSPEERGGKVYLTVTGNAVTFRFLKDEEREQGDGKGGRKGRKGKRKGGS